MKATTPKFKQIMASGSARDYVVKVDLTLADDPLNPTVLHLTEQDIWNDTFSIETASSGTSSFDIGTAVIGQCKFSLNNFDERFNQYDFFNAEATVWVGLVGDETNNTQQYYRMGFFTVDEPTYAGSLIQLVLLDNMWKFDVPMSDLSINYPITALNVVLAICSHCDVTLDQTEQFHGYDFVISKAPEGIDNMNCREFLQYVAMIGCNFCEITPTGQLKLRWYDTSSVPEESDLDGGTFDTNTTPYSDGDSADGGNFTDYTSGDTYDGGGFNDNPNVAYFTRLLNSSFGTDVITITGVKFIIDDTVYDIGEDGYVLELDNPLVNADNVSTVLNLIWDVLEGFSLRTYNITVVSDLSVEIGDCCAIKDYKGNYIYSWITCNSFKFANHIVRCDAINPTRTLTKQYSKVVQAAVSIARKETEEAISDYDVAVQELNRLTNEAMGGFSNYEDAPTGGRYYYVSNQPITKNPTTGVCSFEPGSVVFRLAGDVLSISRDGGQTWVNGYDPTTGTLLVNVLDAIGINADWIKAGEIEAARMATNVITAINAPRDAHVDLTFDSRCETEGTDYDYIRFYYVENNTVYASEKYAGAHLAGNTIRIPRTTFYVEWHSDYSVQYWGIKVTGGGLGNQGALIPFTPGATLPSTTPINIGSNVTQIETDHPYTSLENKLWKVVIDDSSLTISGDKINIDGTVTLTDYTKGLANGSTVISGDCIKTGTLEGITLIAGESTGSKLIIEDGQIKGYYNNDLIGSIRIGRESDYNDVLFDFANNYNTNIIFKTTQDIYFNINSHDVMRIWKSPSTYNVTIDGELNVMGEFLVGQKIGANDYFYCDGGRGITADFSINGHYLSFSGGILTYHSY